MKRFWRNNSRLISKMVVYQLGMIVLGCVTAFATSRSDVWMVLSSAFCSLFYLFLIYTVSYQEGREDGIRIEAGRNRFTPLRLTAVAAVANGLAIILGVFLVIFNAVSGSESVAEAIWLVDNGILHIMYRGLIKVLLAEGGTFKYILTALLPLPAILTATVAYLLGIRFKNGFIRRPGSDLRTERYNTKK